MTWIKVKDKMPEQGKSILVYTERKDIHEGRYMTNFWVIGGSFSFDIGEPTHWMELPNPPKD